MKRYTINISFNRGISDNGSNIVEDVKTLAEAMDYKSIIDDTVKKALIKDNVTGKVIWLKQ